MTARATSRLKSGEVLVGLSGRLDESLLLFEKVLGWERDEILYSRASRAYVSDYLSPILPPGRLLVPPKLPHTRMAAAVGPGWRRNETADLLHSIGSPIRTLNHFYASVAVPEHQRQVRRFLGGRDKVEADVAQLRRQLSVFEPCVEALARASGAPRGSSDVEGAATAAAAASSSQRALFGTCAAGKAGPRHKLLAAQSQSRYDCTGFLRCQGPDCA